MSERVPPGYMDQNKDDSAAAGDYLVWEQVLTEAETTEVRALKSSHRSCAMAMSRWLTFAERLAKTCKRTSSRSERR